MTSRLLSTSLARVSASFLNSTAAAAAAASATPISRAFATTPSSGVKWVFLGAPGVGKGTYSTRVARALGVPHIAAGDLVRAEIKSGSERGNQVGCRRRCRRDSRPLSLGSSDADTKSCLTGVLLCVTDEGDCGGWRPAARLPRLRGAQPPPSLPLLARTTFFCTQP